MSKMHYFSDKLSKIVNHWGISASQCPFTFNFGDLRLRALAKLWFFKLIMTKLNF